MTLVDRTNEDIELSLMEGIDVNGDGTIHPAQVSIDVDGETDEKTGIYHRWVWFMFATHDEPWFPMTYEEAEKVYDRLGRILGKNN